MAQFNPQKDRLAVVIKDFTLQKKSEIFFDRYSEPYIISLAVDESGAKQAEIDFNVLPFPNVRKGDTISFDGQGHLVYGPKNPGSFLAYSVLFMESDKDVREFAEMLEGIIDSEAMKIGIKAMIAAAPTYGVAITALQKLSEEIVIRLQKNKDDLLFRRSGTLLRGVTPPYDILRTYTSSNEFIKTNIKIVPLASSNNLGEQPKAKKIKD